MLNSFCVNLRQMAFFMSKSNNHLWDFQIFFFLCNIYNTTKIYCRYPGIKQLKFSVFFNKKTSNLNINKKHFLKY